MRFPVCIAPGFSAAARRLLLVVALLVGWVNGWGQVITTIAGNGSSSYSGEGGPASASGLPNPSGGDFDKYGNYYFANGLANRINKITVSGTLLTVAGNGTAGFSGDGGLATSARLNGPTAVRVDTSGNIYIADAQNHRIRKVDASTGIISTLAGTGSAAYDFDGIPATNASLNNPVDICLDKSGNLYIADAFNYRIRKVTTLGTINTIAGNGTAGYSGESTTAATSMICFVTGICSDTSGNLFLAYNSISPRIMKLTTLGIMSTVAGNGATSYIGDGIPATSAQIAPLKVHADVFGNLYIADRVNNRLYKVGAASGYLTNIAGNGVTADLGDGGLATVASIYGPSGVTTDSCQNVLVPSVGNLTVPGSGRRIRKITYAPAATTSLTNSCLPNDTICAGTTVTYSTAASGGTAATYQWYKNGVAITGATNSAYSYLPANGDSIKCISMVVASCNAVAITSNTIGMVVNPVITPTVTLAASPGTTVCAGTTVTYTPTVSGSGSSPAYQWFVNGTAVSTASSYSYTPATGDAVYCNYTSTSTCGGTVMVHSDTLHMVVNPVITPTVTITASPGTTVCTGTTVTYTPAVSGAGSSPAYQWYVNGVPAGTSTTYSYIPMPGDAVHCDYTSASTCGGTVMVHSDTLHMVVNPLIYPTATITVTPDDTVCTGTSITATVAVAGGPGLGYAWIVNGASTGGAGSSYSYTPANGDSIRCLVSSTEACTGSAVALSSNSIVFSVQPVVVPAVSITGITSALVGSTVTVTASVTGTTSYTLNWYNHSMLFSTTTVPTTTFIKGAGIDSITARAIPAGVLCYDSSLSNLLTVDVSKTGVAEVGGNTLLLRPNPARDEVVVSSAVGLHSVVVSDLLGRVVVAQACNGLSAAVRLEGSAAGVYAVKVVSEDGGVMVMRVVKE